MTRKIRTVSPHTHTLIQNWEVAKNAADRWREHEMKLREQIVTTLFDPKKESGAETVELLDGLKIRADKKVYYKADAEKAKALVNFLPPSICDELIRWKPDVSVTAYKNALPAFLCTIEDEAKLNTIRAALADAITISPGTPSLEVIRP